MKKEISLLASSLIVLAVCFVSCGGSSSSKGGVEKENYPNVQDERQEQNSIVGKWETNYGSNHVIFTVENSGDFLIERANKGKTSNVTGQWSRNENKIYLYGTEDGSKYDTEVCKILSLDRKSLVMDVSQNDNENILYFTRIE